MKNLIILVLLSALSAGASQNSIKPSVIAVGAITSGALLSATHDAVIMRYLAQSHPLTHMCARLGAEAPLGIVSFLVAQKLGLMTVRQGISYAKPEYALWTRYFQTAFNVVQFNHGLKRYLHRLQKHERSFMATPLNTPDIYALLHGIAASANGKENHSRIK